MLGGKPHCCHSRPVPGLCRDRMSWAVAWVVRGVGCPSAASHRDREIVTTVSRFQCISLLTDYGLQDGFVASCHGVLARLAPGVHVIDVTHLVPPGDIRRGAAV